MSIENFIQDLNVESIKLQLQIVAPTREHQKNDVLKNVFIESFDPQHLMLVIRDQIKIVQQCKSVECLNKLYDNWNINRLQIQEVGYGFGITGQQRAAETYAYVFLMRVFRRHFKPKGKR